MRGEEGIDEWGEGMRDENECISKAWRSPVHRALDRIGCTISRTCECGTIELTFTLPRSRWFLQSAHQSRPTPPASYRPGLMAVNQFQPPCKNLFVDPKAALPFFLSHFRFRFGFVSGATYNSTATDTPSSAQSKLHRIAD